MSSCSNCGHNCHCGNACKQEVINEFGEKYEIECCKNCRCDNVKKSEQEAGFNGA